MFKQDNKDLSAKQKERSSMQHKFDKMREQDQIDRDSLVQAEKRLEAISSGMYSSGDGEAATLQDQLMSKFE